MAKRKRDLIVAVDVGTTGLRVGVVRADLKIEAVAVQSYPTRLEMPGHAEQDPEVWWRALNRAIKELNRKMPGLSSRAAGLIYAAQLCGVVPVDEAGTPLRPCLIWLDKRAAELTRTMMGGFPKVFGYGAFKVLSSLWLTNGAPSLNGMDPPSKMVWLKIHEPEIWERTYKLLDVKDWLVHKSCGRFVTTADAANLTWMMDTRPSRNCWSPMLMSRFGISENLLPEIVPGNSSPGGLTKAASKALGLPEGLPVVAGCGDVCAAALGSGNVADGELHLSLGTSSWIGGFYPSRRLSATESYATILSPVDNRPLLIATQESAGSCLNWFERIGGKRLPVEAKPREQNAEPPLFLPWLAGERVPADDAKLRGAFLGLTLMHDTASMSRAVLEGVALNTRWAYRSVAQQRGTARSRRLRLVGGAAQNRSLCQDLADSLGVDLSVGPAPRMAGVQGAATIAGAALDFFPNTWEAATRLSQEEHSTYVPNPERFEYFNRRFHLFLDAHRRNAPWFRNFFLSELKPQ